MPETKERAPFHFASGFARVHHPLWRFEGAPSRSIKFEGSTRAHKACPYSLLPPSHPRSPEVELGILTWVGPASDIYPVVPGVGILLPFLFTLGDEQYPRGVTKSP